MYSTIRFITVCLLLLSTTCYGNNVHQLPNCNQFFNDLEKLQREAKYREALQLSVEVEKCLQLDLASGPLSLAKLKTIKGELYRELYVMDTAKLLIEEALTLIPEGLPERIVALNAHKRWCIEFGYFDRAAASLREVSAILKKHPEDPELLGSNYVDWMDFFGRNGQVDSAKVYEQKFLAMGSEKWGDDSLNVAYVDLTRAYFHRYLGNIKRAETLCREAQKIGLRLLGKEHPFIADTHWFIGVLYNSPDGYETAILNHQKAISIYSSFFGEDYRKITKVKQNIAELMTYKDLLQNLQSRLDINLYSLKQSRKIFGEFSSPVKDDYLAVSTAYIMMGDESKAILYLRKAVDIALHLFGDKSRNLLPLYIDLGNLYWKNGQKEVGRVYLDKHERLTEFTSQGSDEDLLAACFRRLDLPMSTESKYNLLLKTRALQAKIYGEENMMVSGYDCMIGAHANMLGLYEEAVHKMERGLTKMRQLLGPQNTIIAGLEIFLAEAHIGLGQNEKAIDILEKAGEYVGGNENIALKATLYIGMASAYSNSDQYTKAGAYLKKSRDLLGFSNHIEQVPPEYYLELIKVLQNSAWFYKKQYNKSPNAELIDSAAYYLSFALNVIEKEQENLLNTEDKIARKSQERPIVEQYLSYALESSKHSKKDVRLRSMYDRIQSVKYKELAHSIRQAGAMQFADIPESLIIAEKATLYRISTLKKKISVASKGTMGPNRAVMEPLKNALEEKVLQIDSIKSIFRTNHPKYYDFIYAVRSPTVAEIQVELIDSSQTVLEYFLGDTSLMIFTISKNSYDVKEVRIDSTFHINLSKMTRAGIYGYYNAPPSRQSLKAKARAQRNYAEAAFALYQKVIAPVRDRLTENLIVIPDGAMGYVPFEALLTKLPGNDEAPGKFSYLLKDHQVSYAYSSTLLREMREKEHLRQPKGSVLALAPFYTGNADNLLVSVDTSDYSFALNLKDTLSLLPSSGEEVKAISRTFAGQAYYGQAANIQVFQDLAPNFRALHLSTHGKADDRVGDYAYLAFGMPDDTGGFAKLYARDLYDMTLNADMVVLSACETGVGKLQYGEGIVSLARAFAYAGAKSIFTTLWKVEVNTTKDISISFYQYLKAGATKDAALRQAKLDYLQNNADNAEKLHPFFWAGMIGIGDMRPLVSP